jgi:curved DNA-binding protein CbpA
VTAPNYYEFLQISPNAEADTIHRVYRFLAIRFHPDNPETGDTGKFILLQKAYEVLSDFALRAQYDTACNDGVHQPAPFSESVDFMDSLDGEVNRRLAVLALLYIRRRKDHDRPAVSLFEIEKRMGFPREYLEFTLWYLQRKLYISRADNADFVLLAEGVDYVEAQRLQIPVLNKLLTPGTSFSTGDVNTPADRTAPARGPIIVPVDRRDRPGRRNRADRRRHQLGKG